MSTELACTKAFVDKDGNRFIFPSLVRWPQADEADRPSKSDLILHAMSLSMALGVTAEPEWFEFDPEVFPHMRMNILHSNFAHGGATVMCFAGPQFDLVAAEQTKDPA